MLTIVLTETSKNYEIIQLDGRSTRPYTFAWDKNIGRYAFRTDSQEVVNDLLANAGRNDFYRFSVILPEGSLSAPTGKESLTVPPLPTAPSNAKNLTRHQLSTMLLAAGLYVGPKEATDKLARIAEGILTGYEMAARGEGILLTEPEKPAPTEPVSP